MNIIVNLRNGLCVIAFVSLSAVSVAETDLSCYTCLHGVITADEESTKNEVADMFPTPNVSCRDAIKEEMDIKKCEIRVNGQVAKCYAKTYSMNGRSQVSFKNYSVIVTVRRCMEVPSRMKDQCYNYTNEYIPGGVYWGLSGEKCYCSSETCNHDPAPPSFPINGATTLLPRTVSYFLAVIVAAFSAFQTE